MIRMAQFTDEESLYQLICELEETNLNHAAFSHAWRAQWDDAHYVCLVYEQAGVIIGVCNLRLEEQLHHAAWIAEILELSVKGSHRSAGIGKQLLAAACQLARQRGCIQIEVSSNVKRSAAHRFYQREGFQQKHYKFTMKLFDQ